MNRWRKASLGCGIVAGGIFFYFLHLAMAMYIRSDDTSLDSFLMLAIFFLLVAAVFIPLSIPAPKKEAGEERHPHCPKQWRLPREER